MDNKHVEPASMAVRLIVTYIISAVIVGVICFALVTFLNVIMNISNVIGREDIISLLVVVGIFFIIRTIAWTMSLKISFKDKYVNSLLLKRVIGIISIVLAVYSIITFAITYNKFVVPNKNEVIKVEKEMALLEQNDKGNDQRVYYQEQIDSLTRRNNYNTLIYVGNAGTILLMIPVIWIGMIDLDKKTREA